MTTFVFDTETTNLIANSMQPLEKQPFIIELFGITLDDEGNELARFHQIFDPGIKIPAKVTEITGLTDKDVAGKPKFIAHAHEIKQLIESHDEVVAHNLSYDRSMVNFEMKRSGLTVDWPALICTVEATEHIKGFRLNLNALHELLFGEGFTNAHRAENDVLALARCFNELRRTGAV